MGAAVNLLITYVYMFVTCGGRPSPFFNPLNPELYPICYLLALLGAHHFLHVAG